MSATPREILASANVNDRIAVELKSGSRAAGILTTKKTDRGGNLEYAITTFDGRWTGRFTAVDVATAIKL